MWEWRFCVGYVNSVDPVKMTAWEIMTYLLVMGGRGLSFFLLTQKINDVSHGLNWLTSSLWGKKCTPVILKGWSPGQRDYFNCEMLDMQISGSQPRCTEAEILALDPSHLCHNKPSGWLWCMLKLENHGPLQPPGGYWGLSIYLWLWKGLWGTSRRWQLLAAGQETAVDFLMILKQEVLKHIMKDHLW